MLRHLQIRDLAIIDSVEIDLSGGLTVLTHLNPFLVASHFLLSLVLIAAAVAVYERAADVGDGSPQPLVSTLNSWDGSVVANAAIVPAGTNGAISIYVTNNTHLILDINGYFAP